MDRPRIAAIVSGAAASAAAFVVVSRTSLLGTPAGAAMIPVICTLVSYAASVGLDRAGEWLEFRMPFRGLAKARSSEAGGRNAPLTHEPSETLSSGPEGGTAEEQGVVTYYRTVGRRRMNPQWLLAVSAFVALATSVYAVASPPAAETVEKVVVQRQVIEKTVTVTTEPETPISTGAEAGPLTGERSATTIRVPASPGSVPVVPPTAGGEEADASSPDTVARDGSGVDTTIVDVQPPATEAAESATSSSEDASGGPEAGPSVEESAPPPLTPAP